MALSLIQTISYFWDLTFKLNVLWNIIPLAIATIVILMYFERYREEKAGWNTYLSNSLVLLFVSMALFRYIYTINGAGVFNYVDYLGKTIAAAILLLIGLILLRFNFEHILPERFAKYLGSILTINMIAYAIILFVYSTFPASWNDLFALLIITVTLLIILNLAKFPLDKIFDYIEREKRKEQIKNVKESKYQIGELKRDLKDREKQLTKVKVKEADQEKKQAIKIKKIIKK
jgi:hypothetical protein